jgi:putative ABC transport system permease protein
MVVNETFVKEFDLSDPIGKIVEGSTIIGVVEDFHFNSLAGQIEPIAFYQPRAKQSHRYILVQLQSHNFTQSISNLVGIWNEVTSEVPFQYSFLDEDMQALYEDDARWTKILQWISGLSIFIACIGLIGLVGLTVAKRTKEIGIRKVLGASLSKLLLLLSEDYIKIIIMAFFISIPLANYFMNKWLQNFAYHIEISWWLFVIPGLFILIVAALSVSILIIKAARQNPVDSLRYE